MHFLLALALRSTRATALESEQLLAAEPAQPLPLLLLLRRARADLRLTLGNLRFAIRLERVQRHLENPLELLDATSRTVRLAVTFPDRLLENPLPEAEPRVDTVHALPPVQSRARPLSRESLLVRLEPASPVGARIGRRTRSRTRRVAGGRDGLEERVQEAFERAVGSGDELRQEAMRRGKVQLGLGEKIKPARDELEVAFLSGREAESLLGVCTVRLQTLVRNERRRTKRIKRSYSSRKIWIKSFLTLSTSFRPASLHLFISSEPSSSPAHPGGTSTNEVPSASFSANSTSAPINSDIASPSFWMAKRTIVGWFENLYRPRSSEWLQMWLGSKMSLQTRRVSFLVLMVFFLFCLLT